MAMEQLFNYGKSLSITLMVHGVLAASSAGTTAPALVLDLVATTIHALTAVVLEFSQLAVSYIATLLNRDKCSLACCPSHGVQGSYGCKYQTDPETCKNSYSDYPGHGDHSCWWNAAEKRCEVGLVW